MEYGVSTRYHFQSGLCAESGAVFADFTTQAKTPEEACRRLAAALTGRTFEVVSPQRIRMGQCADLSYGNVPVGERPKCIKHARQFLTYLVAKAMTYEAGKV